MENKDRKVLLQITNLKQYFPVGKRGLAVKANDGITIDIYEGETFGLVGGPLPASAVQADRRPHHVFRPEH